MIDIILMGTACASSGIGRDNTYLLIKEENDECTLIDIGGNPLGKLKNVNIKTGQIKRLLLTHFHIDHIYGLPSLLWGMWIDGRTEPFDIYCAEVNRKWLEDWVEHLQMNQWPISFEIRIHSFDWKTRSQVWSNEELYFSVFPSIHGEEPTVGIEVRYKEKLMVYSSDTVLNSALKQYPKIDLLIHEATSARDAIPAHSSLEGILSFYNLDTIERLLLVHLMDDQPYNEVLTQLPADIFSKITLGSDLLYVSLK